MLGEMNTAQPMDMSTVIMIVNQLVKVLGTVMISSMLLMISSLLSIPTEMLNSILETILMVITTKSLCITVTLTEMEMLTDVNSSTVLLLLKMNGELITAQILNHSTVTTSSNHVKNVKDIGLVKISITLLLIILPLSIPIMTDKSTLVMKLNQNTYNGYKKNVTSTKTKLLINVKSMTVLSWLKTIGELKFVQIMVWLTVNVHSLSSLVKVLGNVLILKLLLLKLLLSMILTLMMLSTHKMISLKNTMLS